jgi:hypothetical protein
MKRLQPKTKTARQFELHARRHGKRSLISARSKTSHKPNALSIDEQEQLAHNQANARMNGIRYDLGTKLSALALLDSGKSANQTARELSVSKATVLVWRDDETLRTLNSGAIDRLKKTFGNLMAKGVDMTAQAIINQPEKVWNQSPKDNAITLGILHQNYRLATDQSTENLSHRGVLEDINAEKAKLSERLRVLTIERNRRKEASPLKGADSEH